MSFCRPVVVVLIVLLYFHLVVVRSFPFQLFHVHQRQTPVVPSWLITSQGVVVKLRSNF